MHASFENKSNNAQNGNANAQSPNKSRSSKDSLPFNNNSNNSNDGCLFEKKSHLSNKKDLFLTKTSQSEANNTSTGPNAFLTTKKFSTQPPVSFQARRKSNTASTDRHLISHIPIAQKSLYVTEEEEEEEDYESLYHELNLKLRTVFTDFIDESTLSPSSLSTSFNDKGNDNIIHILREQFDSQSIQIRRLERVLNEERAANDTLPTTVSEMLESYPQLMTEYRKQIEQERIDKQLKKYIAQFENQKQMMMEENERQLRWLKTKYRSRFDEIVERIISDPSRLDDEWARRIQQEANDRVDEIKKKHQR